MLPLEHFFAEGVPELALKGPFFLCLRGAQGYYVIGLEQLQSEAIQQELETLLETLRKQYPFSQDPELESLLSQLLIRLQSMKHRSRLSRLVNHHLQTQVPEAELFQEQFSLSPQRALHPLLPEFWQDELQRMEVWVHQLEQADFRSAYQKAHACWEEVKCILRARQDDVLKLREAERICLLYIQSGDLVRRYFWKNNQIQKTAMVAADWMIQVIAQAVSAAAQTSQEYRLLRLERGLWHSVAELREMALNEGMLSSSNYQELLKILRALAQGQYPLSELLAVVSKALALAVAERAAAAQEKQPLERGSLRECLQASIYLELAQFTEGDVDMLALHRAAGLLADCLYDRFFCTRSLALIRGGIP